MTKLTKKDFNCETQEETIIELTAEEVKAHEDFLAQIELDRAQKEADEAAKVTARESALAKLGLTAEELEALLA